MLAAYACEERHLWNSLLAADADQINSGRLVHLFYCTRVDADIHSMYWTDIFKCLPHRLAQRVVERHKLDLGPQDFAATAQFFPTGSRNDADNDADMA